MPGRYRFMKLRLKIMEKQMTHEYVAERIGRSATYLSTRMTGKDPFDTNDIRKLADLLEIEKADWLAYFFEIDCAGGAA